MIEEKRRSQSCAQYALPRTLLPSVTPVRLIAGLTLAGAPAIGRFLLIARALGWGQESACAVERSTAQGLGRLVVEDGGRRVAFLI